MENGWMDWIEWMWKVEGGAVPDLTLLCEINLRMYHSYMDLS